MDKIPNFDSLGGCISTVMAR